MLKDVFNADNCWKIPCMACGEAVFYTFLEPEALQRPEAAYSLNREGDPSKHTDRMDQCSACGFSQRPNVKDVLRIDNPFKEKYT